MIGLIFYGAIALWIFIALYLGRKIPKWFKLKPAWSWLFVPLVFFMPVMDEVIAWPHMQMLCRNFEGHKFAGYKFVEGMNEKSAAGRKVYYTEIITPFEIFPPTVKVNKWVIRYVDAVTQETVFSHTNYQPIHGFLHIPAGSSGGAMTAFLKGCTFDQSAYERFKEQFNQLGLTQVTTP